MGKKKKRKATLLLVLKPFSKVLYVQSNNFCTFTPLPNKTHSSNHPIIDIFVTFVPVFPTRLQAPTTDKVLGCYCHNCCPAPVTVTIAGAQRSIPLWATFRVSGQGIRTRGQGSTNRKQRAWQQHGFVEAKNQVKAFGV